MKKDKKIDIVLNGYFRSGTTLIWKFLKENLKDYTCFYEPLHPELGMLVRKEKKRGKKDELHGEFLWQEYLNLDEEALRKILVNNPNLNKNGISNEKALKVYLDEFAKVKGKVLIQPNRMHFFLDLLTEEYDSKVLHVIRHTLDVFDSIERVYLQDKSVIRKVIRNLTQIWAIQQSYAFSIDQDYRWIIKHTGHPSVYQDNWLIRTIGDLDYFSKFVVVWTISNYYAIKSVERNGGRLVVYESFVDEPEKVAKELSEYLNIKIDKLPKIKKRAKKDWKMDKVKNVVSKYGIEKELYYVMNAVKEKGVDYLLE